MAFLQINEVWSGILTISKFGVAFSQFEGFGVAFSQFFLKINAPLEIVLGIKI